MEEPRNDDAVVNKIQRNRNKKLKAAKLHEEKEAERKKVISDTKAAYNAIKGKPAFKDILEKAKTFAAYHTKLAQDGVGYRNTGGVLTNGQPEQEIYYYTAEKRVSELDKAAGILELVDYIERQIADAPVAPIVDKE